MRLITSVIAFVLACSWGTAFAQAVNKGDVEVMGFVGGVTDGDSAGLALLIEWLRLAKDAQRSIQFANMPGQIGALARISEVDDLLTTSAAAATTA